MKNRRRLIFWLVFLAAAGIVAVLPEFLGGNAPVVAPVVRPVPRPATRLIVQPEPHPASPPTPLATLRTASAPEAGPAPEAAASAAATAVTAPAESAAEPAQSAATNLFAAKTWVVPPPPPPPAPPPGPPPPPTAPPLPFRLLGKLDDATTVKAFLQKGEQVYTVGVGDVIDGTYRVDSIKTGQMTLIYLPLSTSQTLTGGGES